MKFEQNLINLVKEHEYLYNPSHKSFKNEIKKELIWAQIALELNKTVGRCKNRWAYLRDRFEKEHTKITSQSGTKTLSTNNWEYYHQMQFLLNLKQIKMFNGIKEPSSSFTNSTQKKKVKKSASFDDKVAYSSKFNFVDSYSHFLLSLDNIFRERKNSKKANDKSENELFIGMILKKLNVLNSQDLINTQMEILKLANAAVLKANDKKRKFAIPN